MRTRMAGGKFWTFVFGIIFGWILLFGGLFGAAYFLDLGSLGLNTGFEDKNGKKLDDMTVYEVLTKAYSLGTNTNTLTLQSIENTYGIDVIALMGFDSAEFAEFKQQALLAGGDIVGSLETVKITAFGDLIKGVVGEGIYNVWLTTEVTVADVVNVDLAKLLKGITLATLGVTGDGLTNMLATKDLGTVMKAVDEGKDPLTVFLEGEKLGVMLGFENVDGVWKKADGTLPDAMTAELCDIDIQSLTSGVIDLLAEVGNVQLGSLMNLKKEGNVWMQDSKPVDGIMQSVGDLTITEITSGNLDLIGEIETVQLGEIFGYTTNGTAWFEDEAMTTPLDTLTNNVASMTIQSFSTNFDINTIVGGMAVGELMGYTTDGTKWFSNGTQITDKITLNLANMQASILTNGTFDFNDVMNGVTISDVITVDSTSSPLLQQLKDVEINSLDQKIATMLTGEAMGFHKKTVDTTGWTQVSGSPAVLTNGTDFAKAKDGVYYEARANNIAVLAGNDAYDFVWYTDAGTTTEVETMEAVFANTSITSMDVAVITERTKSLALADIFSASELSTGVLSLLPADATLGTMATDVTSVVSNSTMGELVDSGVLSFSAATVTKLNSNPVLSSWRNWTISTFVETLVGLVP